MFPRIFAALRENYIGLQVWALIIYLVLDACGFGLGIFNHIINRPLANTGKFHIGNLFVGAPPHRPHSADAHGTYRRQCADRDGLCGRAAENHPAR